MPPHGDGDPRELSERGASRRCGEREAQRADGFLRRRAQQRDEESGFGLGEERGDREGRVAGAQRDRAGIRRLLDGVAHGADEALVGREARDAGPAVLAAVGGEDGWGEGLDLLACRHAHGEILFLAALADGGEEAVVLRLGEADGLAREEIPGQLRAAQDLRRVDVAGGEQLGVAAVDEKMFHDVTPYRA